MRARAFKRLEDLRAAFWFRPAVMSVLAVGLYILTRGIDASLSGSGARLPEWLVTSDLRGARQLVATLVQSVLSVAGILFSVTMAALTMASSQYGPRLLRNFMADGISQSVLGVFTGTALYGYLLLRGLEEGRPIPHVSLGVALGLAFLTVGALVWFIHHLAVSIHADNLAATVSHDLRRTVDRIFPAGAAGAPEGERPELPARFEAEARLVLSREQGYVQEVDDHALIELARRRDLIIRLERRPGDHVIPGTELARVWPPDGGNVEREVNRAFALGRQRTPEQDLEFVVHELVEIAVRALSPALNDPFVAVACIDRLAEGLARAAEQDVPQPYRYDSDGRLRLVAHPVTFAELLSAAFDLPRHYGRHNLMVVMRLQDALRDIGDHVKRDEDRRLLLHHARLVHRAGQDGLLEPHDRERALEAWERTVQVLEPDGR